MKTTVFALAFWAITANAANWTTEKANEWFDNQPWPVGCNFIPSTAINQLEMWQAETFDPATIERELGWAEQMGFNSVRVFLHDIPWAQDSQGYLRRIEQFLAISDKHHIRVMFVLLDSCWNPLPKAGKQPEPKPHVHNSGWVQAPGYEILKDPARHHELESYVKGVIGHFAADKRVIAWDLFNEPDFDNSGFRMIEPANKADLALLLLKKEFAWAREVNPSQPLTTPIWNGNWSSLDAMSPICRYMIENSDVISFHWYDGGPEDMQKRVAQLKQFGRPLLCTEYLARPNNSNFNPILGYLKSQRVAAYNWGFVNGKTQTSYPWSSWETTYTNEPVVWFHDVFHKDGTPFDVEEIKYIEHLTQPARK